MQGERIRRCSLPLTGLLLLCGSTAARAQDATTSPSAAGRLAAGARASMRLWRNGALSTQEVSPCGVRRYALSSVCVA
jgi:hypothetical protein